jgi:hypothetical protein
MTIASLAQLFCLTTILASIFSALPSSANACENFAGYRAVEFDEDMVLPGEGKPHGVPPSYDWYLRGRTGAGNNKGRFNAITAWGQIFENESGSSSRNTRIQIRNLRLYVLDGKDRDWHVLQRPESIVGAHYKEDYAGNISRPAKIRKEETGGVSFLPEPGWNFHFFPPDRASLIDVYPEGVFVAFEARLILNNPMSSDDRKQSNFLMGAGADYWLDKVAEWDQYRTNRDVGISRFKRITAEWRWVSMTTTSIAGSVRCPVWP